MTPKTPFRYFRVAMTLLMLCAGQASQAAPLDDHQRHVGRAGSLLQYGIPATAFLATWLLEPHGSGARDPAAGTVFGAPAQQPVLLMGGTPRHDLTLALGRTWLATEALKYGTDETRPNGGPRSFPSGHTSIAFAGAEFIRKEYGWGWAAPAYLAAGFVGWSRVEARKHYTHDVIAGAAVGILANHDFWRRRDRSGELHVAPMTMDWNGRWAPGLQFELAF
jgi:membrane-associated phospholipid phosphatase